MPHGSERCSHCGAPAPEDVTSVTSGPRTRFATGDVIDGRYEIVEILPTGGMGELYKVRHVHLGDFRVVKLRKPMGPKDDTGRKRFAREARLAASIKHPNLATLYDFSTLPDGSHYMVFEYVDGLTIAEHIQAGGRFETTQVLRVAEQTLKALSVLHNAGIIHRDIASDNLMLAVAPGGETIVKVIDLGIAKPLEGEGLTSTGFFVGKARYASPEQVNTQDPTPIDTRSDLYSLGVVLYEMVSGDVPFASSTPAASVIKRLTQDVTTVPPRDTSMILEHDVEAFILSLLKRDREERVHDADDALETVKSLLASRPDGNDGSALARITRDRVLHKLAGAGEPGNSGEMPVPRKSTLEMSLDELQKAQLDDLRDATHNGTVKPQLETAPPSDTPVEETEALPKLDKEARDRLMRQSKADQSKISTDQIPIADAEPDDAAQTMPFDKYKRSGDAPPPNSSPPFNGESSDTAPPTSEPDTAPGDVSAPPIPEPPSTKPLPPPPPRSGAGTAPPVTLPPRPTPYTAPVETDTRRKTFLILTLLLVFALLALGVAGFAAYKILQRITESSTPAPTAGVTIETTSEAPESTTGTGTEIREIEVYGPPPPEDLEEPKAAAPTPPPKPRPAPPHTPTTEPEPEPEPVAVEQPEQEPEPPPPPPVVEGDLVQPGPDVQDASIIAKASLRLPFRARMRRAKGTATIDILIGINGVPDEVRMVKRSGDADIDEAALEAARNSRFIPATKDGVRVRIWKRLEYGNDE